MSDRRQAEQRIAARRGLTSLQRELERRQQTIAPCDDGLIWAGYRDAFEALVATLGRSNRGLTPVVTTRRGKPAGARASHRTASLISLNALLEDITRLRAQLDGEAAPVERRGDEDQGSPA